MTALPATETLEFDADQAIESQIIGGPEEAVAAANQIMAGVPGFQASLTNGLGNSGPGSFVAALSAERGTGAGFSR